MSQLQFGQVNQFVYLDSERSGRQAHEYVNGRVYALAGGTIAHAQLVANVFAAAWGAARKAYRCNVMSQCALVSVPSHNSYYYPDVLATCEKLGDGDEQLIHEPCFIVEVLSPKTASIDKREKRLAYTSLASLHEYVLVYQNRMRVDVYQRAGSEWNVTILLQPQHSVTMSCLGESISLDQIYRGVRFPSGVSEAFDDDDEWDLPVSAP